MNEFEREVSEMLHERVAGIPEPDATPDLLVRARRRRTTKRTALVAAVVLCATGATAAVAQGVTRNGASRVSTTPTAPTGVTTTAHPLMAPPTAVQTIACPITYALTPDTPLPAPSLEPRVPQLDRQSSLDQLVSYAATTDPRFVVLGPKGWKCEATIAADGQNGLSVFNPATIRQQGPFPESGSIRIINDYLWHGGVGSALACSVFDDPAVVQYMTANYPELLPCPRASRKVTRISTHEQTVSGPPGHDVSPQITALESTFVDPDGSRGVAWMLLPSGNNTDDGKISVLTCQPNSGVGLSADECDTVIADYAARIDHGR